ncbi:MAG: phosphohistidine phosphatase SixA [Planctomycetota bacterium]|jgi:phosphohistidine phosphatase
MKLYLVQHGEALPKEADPQRPLSDRGREDVERMAAFLGGAGIRLGTVWHSGKLRAEQTAELLAASLGVGVRLEKVSGINPLDPTNEFARTIAKRTEDMMVVGHLPFMAKLVSHLIVLDEAASTVAFRPGTIVCLELTEEGQWHVVWMLRPELLT